MTTAPTTAEIAEGGDTPKPGYVWCERAMREPGGSRDVASMIMMLRLMKASSLLWHPDRA